LTTASRKGSIDSPTDWEVIVRKVTSSIVRAWQQGKSKTVSNTHTDGESIWLWGNKIVRTLASGEVQVSTSGWNTLTTRERLNGICGQRVTQCRGQLFMGSEPWDGSWITVDI
jgi:hypothetical protein